MQSTEKNQDGSFLLDYRLPELMEDKTAGTNIGGRGAKKLYACFRSRNTVLCPRICLPT